ncbi:MAG: hypothetical protein JSR18_08215 [Proteobacteria bacterium]|nr:hypothetical protein [Pseudomonadota bacterium]
MSPSVRAMPSLRLCLLLAAALPAVAGADTLALWNPTGTINSSTPLAPTSVASGVTAAGNLTLGPALSDPGPFANAFVGNGWPAGALDTTAYLSFSTTGTITYQSVVFSLYNNFDGTGAWELRSSVDGFASALASGTFSTIAGGGQLISADVSALGTRTGTVEFRLYTDGNAGTTNPLQRGIRGTAGGGSGLAVDGIVAATPPVITTTTPVPTLSPLLLATLAAALAAAGALLRRHRRA